MFTIDGVAATTQEVIQIIIPFSLVSTIISGLLCLVLMYFGGFIFRAGGYHNSTVLICVGVAIMGCALYPVMTMFMGSINRPVYPDIKYEIVELETPKEEYYYKTKSNDLPKVLYQDIKGQGHISGVGNILASSVSGGMNIQTDNTEFYQLEVLKDGLLSLTNIPTTMVKKKEVPSNEEDIYKVEAIYKEIPIIFSENEAIDTKIKETIAGTDQATQLILEYYIVEVPKY